MNKNLEMVYTYHNETKHSNRRYAKSLGYMDWATQPDPYRSYKNTKQTVLPLSFDNHTIPYSDIFNSDSKEITPLSMKSISQFLQFSLGLSAIKTFQGQSWALRCNASSGNLQPTEAYIICDKIVGIESGIHHYSPKNHNLELLANAKKELKIPKNSFLVGISSIIWREAWKYGERSWRYTQLDCGHAFRALEVSAYILGWKVTRLNLNEEELSSLIGLDQKDRYVKEERENPEMLLSITLDGIDENINIGLLRDNFDDKYYGIANNLSLSWHKWEILDKIENATQKKKIVIKKDIKIENKFRKNSFESKYIVLNRRSAQVMDSSDSNITFNEFEIIISSVNGTLDENKIAVNLIFFIHNIQELDSGLYIMLRDISHKDQLILEFKDEFLWKKIETKAGDLFLLQNRDYRILSKSISCNQDIAKDGAFSIGMLAQFDEQLKEYGSHRYRELYWECGAIGQQLYLEASSLGLSATGIGCYLDDLFHHELGIRNMSFQSLYHFTIGRALLDSRLTNLQPYQNRY